MNEYTYTVTVVTDSEEHADMVMRERHDYDEQLYDVVTGESFQYTISSVRTEVH